MRAIIYKYRKADIRIEAKHDVDSLTGLFVVIYFRLREEDFAVFFSMNFLLYFFFHFLVVDSKCNYPAACNAMETLLVDKALFATTAFEILLQALKNNNVRRISCSVLYNISK